MTAGGPSIDYVAGTRLRPSSTARASIVFPAGFEVDEWRYEPGPLFGENGSPPYLASLNPRDAAAALFASVTPSPAPGPTPTPTLHDRLLGQPDRQLRKHRTPAA